MIEVVRYVAESGKDVVGEWLANLSDPRARAKVSARLTRLLGDNFGDCKPLKEGIWELRIDWGPGYRVYYAMIGRLCVLLLCGGDKRSPQADIKRAVENLDDYRKGKEKP